MSLPLFYLLPLQSPSEPSSVRLSSGEFVAQFKFTVLLMANGPHRITNGLFEPDFYKSDYEVQDPELKVGNSSHSLWKRTESNILLTLKLLFQSLLLSSASRKTQKKKKKKVSYSLSATNLVKIFRIVVDT